MINHSPKTHRLAATAASLLAVTAASAGDGPGLGNLHYQESEHLQMISKISENSDNGAPVRPSNAPKKHWGMNTGSMVNGYFAVPFAYDSGGPGGGLLVYDLSDPRAPKLVKRVYDQRTDDFREIHSMGFSKIDGETVMILQSHKGIQCWDMTKPAEPERIGSLNFLPGGDYANTPWQHFYQHPYVYVTGANTGLWIIDVTDVRNPKVADRGGKPNPLPLSQLGGFRAGPIWAMGNRMVITSMDNHGGIAQLDISDPLHPTLTSSIQTNDEHYYSSSFNGETLTLTNRKDPVATFFDLRDPQRITRTFRVPSIKQDQLYAASQDDHFFIGAHYSAIKMKVDGESTPEVLAKMDYPKGVDSADEVTVLGNVLFLGSDHGPTSYFVPHQQEPDTTPPTVRTTSPLDQSVGQSVRSRIGIAFSDNMDLRTLDGDAISVRPVTIDGGLGDAVKGTVSSYWNLVNFTPHAPLQSDTLYEVRIDAGTAKDWAGNAMADPMVIRFTTGAAPVLSSDQTLAVKYTAPTEAGLGAVFRLDGEFKGRTFRWDFGDGSVEQSDGGKVVHTFAKPGRYQISVSGEADGQRASASFIHRVYSRPTDHAPQRTNQIASIAQPYGSLVITANPDNDTISAVRHVTKWKHVPGLKKNDPRHPLQLMWEAPTGDHPRTLAVAPDGKTLWVACKDDATVAVHDMVTGAIRHTIPMPRGSQPFGVVFSPQGDAAFVSLEGTGELVKLSLEGQIIATNFAVDTARGIAITGDGKRLFVTQFLAGDTGAKVVELSPENLSYRSTYSLPVDSTTRDDSFMARGLPNYLSSITISPDGKSAWLPSKKDNILRGHHVDGNTPTFETSVRPIVSRIDLESGNDLGTQIMDLNDRAMPSNVVFTPLGDIAFITTEGTNTIEIRDANNFTSLGNVFVSGLAPRGLAMDERGAYLFVQNFTTRSLECYDVRQIRNGVDYSQRMVASVPLVAKEKLKPDELLGKQIFYNSADGRMARDGYISCATCHDDGGHDGRTWDFTNRGEGVRNTPTLRGRAGEGHGPVHWSANFDEIHDFEHDIRGPFGGTGMMSDADFNEGTRSEPRGDTKEGHSPELDQLAAYLRSLTEVPESPHKKKDGSLTDAALRGRDVFVRQQCASCHAGPELTDSARTASFLTDVGTLTGGSGQRLGSHLPGIDVPSLKGLWATAPYLHDGSAATLDQVLTHANAAKHGGMDQLKKGEVADLVAFLKQLDEHSATGLPAEVSLIEFKTGAVAYDNGRHHFSIAAEDLAGARLVLERQAADGTWEVVDQPLFTRRFADGVHQFKWVYSPASNFRYKIVPLDAPDA